MLSRLVTWEIKAIAVWYIATNILLKAAFPIVHDVFRAALAPSAQAGPYPFLLERRVFLPIRQVFLHGLHQFGGVKRLG